MKIEAWILNIPFKVVFKHNSASRSETSTFWVQVTFEGVVGIGEGCPREYVTGETEQSCLQFFDRWKEIWMGFSGWSDLEHWAAHHAKEIDQNLSAWCAVEMAFLDAWAQYKNKSVSAFLGVSSKPMVAEYSAILGDASESQWQAMCDWHLKNEMKNFKLKVNADVEIDRWRVEYILSKCPEASIRLDANNMWEDFSSVQTYLNALPAEVFAIEEPLKVPQWQALNELVSQSHVRVILDEHVCVLEDLIQIEYPARMILNIRVSKCGGIIRSIALGRKALDLGMKIIIGAQVGESSALTRAGLIVHHALDGEVWGMEGAYGLHLLEEDFFREHYQFGKAGKLPYQF